ncbi:MAG: hypothetical protein KC417_12330, partial [Myxococcales bacterium]|nr:hypothetical protein [Myxococcales bacterium]
NASFKDAGQYALAQASFGLDGNGLFNTSPQAPGIHGVFQAIAVDNTWSQSHGHYSGFPLHLYGTWRANLTRVHFAVNGGDFASTCRGPSGFTCNSPEWAGKIDSAGTH